MPGWDHYPVREHLGRHFAVAAAVDNDANLLGLGEQRPVYPGAHLILFVKVGTGVGSSVIIDGKVLRGSDSVEGDIGHAKIPGVEETCSSCGARGCLAAIASGRAMVRDLRRLGLGPTTTGDVVDLVRAGNPDAVRVVNAAGSALGDVLSTAVSLLNPDLVVIGGDIAHAHEHFLHGVRHTLLSRSQPLATAHLRIDPESAGRPGRHHRGGGHGRRRGLRQRRRGRGPGLTSSRHRSHTTRDTVGFLSSVTSFQRDEVSRRLISV